MIKGKKWYALLTRSRFENVVHDCITKKSIEVFLPKIKVLSTRKDRRIMIDAPLFPGYLFVKTSSDPEHQLKILKTTGAVRLLGYNNGPVPVPSSTIHSLKIMTESGMEVIRGTIDTLSQGTPVIITKGPMAGVKGEFIRYKGNKSRVIIRIETMGQFAGVETDKDNLEKLPDIMT